MECCVSVRVRAAQLLMITALVLTAATSRADVAVVLVTDKDSTIEIISSLDIRKIYLVISVSNEGNVVRALRRRDDERLNQIFLQSVIAMSQRSYERRLLSLALKFGNPRPTEVDSHDELLDLLARNTSTIAYMWKSEAESDPSVKIIKVLWQDT